MRKEREGDPLYTPDEKTALRWAQINSCEENARNLNFKKLPKKALLSYMRLQNEIKLGTDISQPEYKRGREHLFIDSIPILSYGMTAGYLKRTFEKLKISSSFEQPRDSFCLLETEGSRDSKSFDDSKNFIGLFQEYPQAWNCIEKWTPFDGAKIFIESIEGEIPIFPNLRRDLSARSGLLQDLDGKVGGARLSIPTNIYGVLIESDYDTGYTEFPDIEVVTVKLK